jgi:hypothetical protein
LLSAQSMSFSGQHIRRTRLHALGLGASTVNGDGSVRGAGLPSPGGAQEPCPSGGVPARTAIRPPRAAHPHSTERDPAGLPTLRASTEAAGRPAPLALS